MNKKVVIVALIAGAWMLPAQAAELVTGTRANVAASTRTFINATTIAASTMISPGRYSVSIVPSINRDMAGRLAKAVGNVRGVKSVTSSADDSLIHFTVKNGASVRVADIQKAVVEADAEAAMSAPLLEGSMNPNPGL